MPLPRAITELNKTTLNKATSRFADRVPGFGIVTHQGRKSGRTYHTPVNVFRSGDRFTFALTYGVGDWTRNVLAAGNADVLTRNTTYHLTNPRIVNDPDRSRVPLPVRGVLTVLNVDDFLLMDLASAMPDPG